MEYGKILPLPLVSLSLLVGLLVQEHKLLISFDLLGKTVQVLAPELASVIACLNL